MLIKTINPIYVNNVKESRPSEYLSFDASKSSSDQIKAFQKWHNKKGYTPKLVEDGVVTKGKNTEKAIAKYGSEFDSVLATLMNITTGGGSGNTSSTPSTTEQIEQAKKGKVWDKAKGWVASGKASELLANVQSSGGIKGFFKGLIGGGAQAPSTDAGSTAPTDTEIAPDGKPKWSTGKKVLVFGGSALVLGLIIYAVTRPKK